VPSRPPRGPLPFAAALVVTVLAVGAATPGAFPPTAAQTTDAGAASPPVATVEPITLAPSLPPPLDVTALSVTPEGTAVRVSVDFAEPFTAPAEGYRLSVSVGDPSGQRTRASLVPADGAAGAVVEVGNGLTFRDGGPTTVEVGEAVVEVVVPVDDVGPGAALWVDGEVADESGGVITAATPAFAYDALVGRSIDGAAPGGTRGWTTTAAGQRFADPVLVGGAPPTVATRNRVVTVDAVDPAPTSLLGRPVVGADLYLGVRLTGAAGPQVDGGLLIDRTNGVVTLLGPAGTPVEAASPDGGDRSWLVEDLTGPAADGPLSVSIEPEAVAALLGGPFDRSTFAVDLASVYALDDGRVVTVSGVATTLAWLDQLAAEVPASTTTSAGTVAAPSGDEGSFPLLPALAALAGVLVLAGIVAAVVARRRRRRERAAAVDGRARPAPEPLLDVRGGASTRPPEPPVEVEPGPEPRPEPDSPVEVEPEPEPRPEPDAPVEPEPVPAVASRAPDDVLAAFEAELAELSDRVDRLDRGGAPEPGPDRDG
jgi:hypothetical protein